MFNALNSLGGGGLDDPKAQDKANTALYATLAVFGIFAGTFTNLVGLRFSLAFGGLGYSIYAASLFNYSRDRNMRFVTGAGIVLGLCAGPLWTVQGTMLMSYPKEKSKGRYIAWFSLVYNLGAVVGAVISLVENINKTSDSISDVTYITFISLMAAGCLLALLVCNADKVDRKDNREVVGRQEPELENQAVGFWQTIYQNLWVVMLFPMFFSSNIFYVYQSNGMNGAHFTIRTRALNSALYWISEILGSFACGYALDFKAIRRHVRAKISLVMLVVLTSAIWGGGYAWQKQQVSRAVSDDDDYGKDKIDWVDGVKYITPMFIYSLFGFHDAIWQSCIYWYLGALSNSGRKAANYSGFFRSLQATGAAIFWHLDSRGTPYDIIFIATWSCLSVSLLFAAPVVFLRIKDSASCKDGDRKLVINPPAPNGPEER